MLEGEMFDKLEFIARRIRGRQEAFGGIQLILTGQCMGAVCLGFGFRHQWQCGLPLLLLIR